jgi:hypothetical protein
MAVFNTAVQLYQKITCASYRDLKRDKESDSAASSVALG